MKTIKLILIACGLFLSGQALAECPVSLTYDQLVDCIVVEGAGDRYDTNTSKSN